MEPTLPALGEVLTIGLLGKFPQDMELILNKWRMQIQNSIKKVLEFI